MRRLICAHPSAVSRTASHAATLLRTPSRAHSRRMYAARLGRGRRLSPSNYCTTCNHVFLRLRHIETCLAQDAWSYSWSLAYLSLLLTAKTLV